MSALCVAVLNVIAFTLLLAAVYRTLKVTAKAGYLVAGFPPWC